MNLHQLEVFQAVMQTRSMTAAGRIICVSPSAVSKTIAHVESRLGYKLFVRLGKTGLTPTPEALLLFSEFASISGKLDSLRKLAINLRQMDKGSIRLAVAPAIAHQVMPEVLQEHARCHPEVKVEVRTIYHDEIPAAVLSRSVEFAIGCGTQNHPLLHERVIARGPLYAAVAREIWLRAIRTKPDSPIEFLAKVPMIQLLPGDPIRESARVFSASLNLQRESNLEVQTTRLALELVRRGLGWSIIDFVSAAHLDSPSVVAIELSALPSIALHAYHPTAMPLGQGAIRMLELFGNQICATPRHHGAAWPSAHRGAVGQEWEVAQLGWPEGPTLVGASGITGVAA